MPATVALAAEHVGRVAAYEATMRATGHKTGRSTMQAARTFSVKLERAGGWNQMSRAHQLDAIAKARSFASWMMVTGQLTIDADVLGRVYLRLGTSARSFCPEAHGWFVEACHRINIRPGDVALQWNALAMITAVTGFAPNEIGDQPFESGSTAILDAYVARGKPESGRNMASIFHRLRLTLFHAGGLDTHRRPARRPPVSVTGWTVVAPGFAQNARRYVAQVELSLRPATTKHIESDLREFGTWLATSHPEVASCVDLERRHIEAYKAWVSAKLGRHTGKPLSRISIKNRLINLHCFFDRITEWGYPDPPQRPLIFAGDLPIVDKPLPRFLDDAAATKLMRASRADPDPLSRLIVELGLGGPHPEGVRVRLRLDERQVHRDRQVVRRHMIHV
nr:integrase [Acidimicrobiia bacterium]